MREDRGAHDVITVTAGGEPVENVGAVASHGSALEVLKVSTKLGLTSFGGPIAHLGYFRTEYVERRRWLSEEEYAGLRDRVGAETSDAGAWAEARRLFVESALSEDFPDFLTLPAYRSILTAE